MELFIVLLILGCYGTAAASGGCGFYSSIISFGASLSDTGNFMLSHGDRVCQVCSFPYGENYFHRPTGRYSDGRIFLDFLAEALGLPFVPPFLGGSDEYGFQKGVNFAVGGATALDNSFYEQKGFSPDGAWTNYSLGVQLEWFKQLLPSLCSSHSSRDCDILRKSIVIVGEFGANDYNYPVFGNMSETKIRRTYIPKVVEAISSAITELIDLGASMLLVPGMYPIGCNALYLTVLASTSDYYYDLNTGCIKWLNKVVEYHNEMLLEELDQIRRAHPSTTIIYVDSYNNTLDMLRSPSNYGFGYDTLVACCGGGGTYNCNISALCGTKKADACSDPSRYIYWDQLHFTEVANKIIANGLLNNLFTNSPINEIIKRASIEQKPSTFI